MSKSLSPPQMIHTFLAVARTASLATVDHSGAPHAANIQFVAFPDLSLCFASSTSSAHSVHLAFEPRAAVTIYGHQDGPETIMGLQMHGKCRPLTDLERARYEPPYARKFPIVTESPAMAQRFAGMTLYLFEPTWARWIDNHVHFGFKLEFTPGAGQTSRTDG